MGVSHNDRLEVDHMNRKYKWLVLGLIVSLLLASWPAAIFAADRAIVSDEPANVPTKVFDGYTVTVVDQATPAVDMRGRVNDPTVMCFVSAADVEVGVISYKYYNAIITKNKTVVKLDDGGTYGIPPDGSGNWHDWFADHFNRFRGLSVESREIAVAAHKEEKIEEYRQELIRLVNLEREKAGLPAYIVSEECMEYSQIRAQELPGNFSHTRPDGTNAGYEIIAMGAMSPEGAVSGWMNSPGHKAAILNENRVYVGAGVHMNPNGTILWQMYFERDPEIYANTLIFG